MLITEKTLRRIVKEELNLSRALTLNEGLFSDWTDLGLEWGELGKKNTDTRKSVVVALGLSAGHADGSPTMNKKIQDTIKGKSAEEIRRLISSGGASTDVSTGKSTPECGADEELFNPGDGREAYCVSTSSTVPYEEMYAYSWLPLRRVHFTMSPIKFWSKEGIGKSILGKYNKFVDLRSTDSTKYYQTVQLIGAAVEKQLKAATSVDDLPGEYGSELGQFTIEPVARQGSDLKDLKVVVSLWRGPQSDDYDPNDKADEMKQMQASAKKIAKVVSNIIRLSLSRGGVGAGDGEGKPRGYVGPRFKLGNKIDIDVEDHANFPSRRTQTQEEHTK